MDKIRVNNYKIENPKIKDKTRIVCVSDIHSEIEKLDQIFELLKKVRADIVCMPGDIIDSISDKRNKDILDLLRRISCLAKTYISLGNHDIYQRGLIYKTNEEPNIEFFKELESKSDCTVLADRFESVRHDDNIVINALNFPLNYYTQKEDERISDGIIGSANTHLDTNSYNILLSHSPNRILYEGKIMTIKAILNEVDLILSGHNHGCLTPMFIQNRSKSKTGLVGPYRQLFVKNGFGYYSTNQANLIINNGVTKIAKTTNTGTLGEIVNKFFIPDVDVINLEKGKDNTLELKNRRIVRM